jgi:hypothetical protein
MHLLCVGFVLILQWLFLRSTHEHKAYSMYKALFIQSYKGDNKLVTFSCMSLSLQRSTTNRFPHSVGHIPVRERYAVGRATVSVMTGGGRLACSPLIKLALFCKCCYDDEISPPPVVLSFCKPYLSANSLSTLLMA